DLPDLRLLAGALPDREQGAVAGPANVVDPEAERDLVPRDLRRPARDSRERLAAPRRHVDGAAVVRKLDAVRARRLAARHLLPAAVRMPLPQLAVRLAL